VPNSELPELEEDVTVNAPPVLVTNVAADAEGPAGEEVSAKVDPTAETKRLVAGDCLLLPKDSPPIKPVTGLAAVSVWVVEELDGADEDHEGAILETGAKVDFCVSVDAALKAWPEVWFEAEKGNKVRDD
jgi:hypothetical protein